MSVHHRNSVSSVNKVVPKAQVLATALEWAKQINLSSPDSIQSTKRALLLNKQKADVEEVVVAHMRSEESKRAYAGENMKASRYFPCHLSHTHDHQGGSYGIYPGEHCITQCRCVFDFKITDEFLQRRRPVWVNPAKL